MGYDKNDETKSRRWFLSLFKLADNPAETKKDNPNMVKMLTADGKLVEIDKAVLAAATKNKPSTKKEIFDWMDNPSKEKNS